MIQSNETKSLEHSLWKAQLQIIFPMIESERIQMIERYRDVIEEAVKQSILILTDVSIDM